METMTLANLLNNISSILASVLDWVPDVFETMIASPLMMLIIGFAAVGTIVAFAKKLLG